ncbi:helix-turn-helix domain-containing protein [Enemella evansiae]|uniref:helix-turn-helix domain-containing protein n=1 Tax=Enemella evansiae TaxID=2016499 RepID=UPI001E4D0E02|nr:helix-turn-helix domain-containing protein [Enemella evansiae]
MQGNVPRRSDDIERAHLRDPRDERFTIHRYPPGPELSGLIRRYWIPVWQVPAGQRSEQKVLQYPICLAITTPAYSRFVGPNRGLSITVLEGNSWGFGVMFTPAAGALLLGGSVARLTDAFIDLDSVEAFAGVAAQLLALMTPDPHDAVAHAAGRSVIEDRLRGLLPLDEESALVNAIVERVESDESVRSVGELGEVFGLGERTLQRLLGRRIGLSPLWLIRRHRLHEAADRLGQGIGSLAEVATELGYADQAHFSRDFKTATGWTPGEFARLRHG